MTILDSGRMSDSVLDRPVLSLNAHWFPVGQVTTRRAIEDMTSESIYGDAPKLGVDIEMEEDGETIAYFRPVPWTEWVSLSVRPGDGFIQCKDRHIRAPTVIICQHYDKIHPRNPHLNSSAIFERDGYRCQYCGHVFTRKELNLDHIVPQDPRYGGKTTWTNVVCSCIKCNTKKANRLPHEAGMKLLRKPKMPSSAPITFDFKVAKHPTWRPFITEKK